MSRFTQRLEQASTVTKSLVCVGLDPDPARMPVDSVYEFNRVVNITGLKQENDFGLGRRLG